MAWVSFYIFFIVVILDGLKKILEPISKFEKFLSLDCCINRMELIFLRGLVGELGGSVGKARSLKLKNPRFQSHSVLLILKELV